MSYKKKIRGGNRIGSGRKKADYKTKTIAFRVRIEWVEVIKSTVKAKVFELSEKYRITTFSQIADGGNLEPQMFGLTTKFDKMQKDSINHETPTFGNVLLCDVWVRADKPVREYPLGTKFKALMGGHWIRVERGFKWCTGSTFPNVGGDWTGEVCLPNVT